MKRLRDALKSDIDQLNENSLLELSQFITQLKAQTQQPTPLWKRATPQEWLAELHRLAAKRSD